MCWGTGPRERSSVKVPGGLRACQFDVGGGYDGYGGYTGGEGARYAGYDDAYGYAPTAGAAGGTGGTARLGSDPFASHADEPPSSASAAAAAAASQPTAYVNHTSALGKADSAGDQLAVMPAASGR